MKRKCALVSGVNGQAGSYLAELLLEKGYSVHGLIRRTSGQSLWRISHILDKLTLHIGDITDLGCITRTIREVHPDEIYHLAAQSFVGTSWQEPTSTIQVNTLGTLNILEAVRAVDPSIRVLFAGSSEQFGNSESVSQSETTPMHPVSPYGVSKLAAYELCRVFRESHGVQVSCSIAFNHESPRRGTEFVTSKIAEFAARRQSNKSARIALGLVTARRDWSFAGDISSGYYAILQFGTPADFVLGSGKSSSVLDFLSMATGLEEEEALGLVDHDASLDRPTDVYHLCADASKAKRLLGWEQKVTVEELARMMVEAKLEANREMPSLR
jgi:GDPmannose 4,6-dehydratase